MNAHHPHRLAQVPNKALTDLCADPVINLMGCSLEAIRDDLASKLARYNESRQRRGLAPIANLRDVA